MSKHRSMHCTAAVGVRFRPGWLSRFEMQISHGYKLLWLLTFFELSGFCARVWQNLWWFGSTFFLSFLTFAFWHGGIKVLGIEQVFWFHDLTCLLGGSQQVYAQLLVRPTVSTRRATILIEISTTSSEYSSLNNIAPRRLEVIKIPILEYATLERIIIPRSMNANLTRRKFNYARDRHINGGLPLDSALPPPRSKGGSITLSACSRSRNESRN